EDLIPLEPLAAKFEAFGCRVETVDGHDFESIDRGFTRLDGPRTGPRVVIATTVRGKGLPSIEARADRWFCRFSPEEVATLLDELEGIDRAAITSEPLVVR